MGDDNESSLTEDRKQQERIQRRIQRRIQEGYYTQSRFLQWWRSSDLEEDALWFLRFCFQDGVGSTNWLDNQKDDRYKLFLAYFNYFLRNQQRNNTLTDQVRIFKACADIMSSRIMSYDNSVLLLLPAMLDAIKKYSIIEDDWRYIFDDTSQKSFLDSCCQHQKAINVTDLIFLMEQGVIRREVFSAFAPVHEAIFSEVIAKNKEQLPGLMKQILSLETNFWLRQLILSSIGGEGRFFQLIVNELREGEDFLQDLTDVVKSIFRQNQHTVQSFSFLFSYEEKQFFLYQLRIAQAQAQGYQTFLSNLLHNQQSWEYRCFSFGIDAEDSFGLDKKILNKKILNWMAQYADTVAFNEFIDSSLQGMNTFSPDSNLKKYLKAIVEVTLRYQSPRALAHLFEKHYISKDMLPMLAGQHANMYYYQQGRSQGHEQSDQFNQFLVPFRKRYDSVLQAATQGQSSIKHSVVVFKSSLIARVLLHTAVVILVQIPLFILISALAVIVLAIFGGPARELDFTWGREEDRVEWGPYSADDIRNEGKKQKFISFAKERKMFKYFVAQERKHISNCFALHRSINNRTCGVKLPVSLKSGGGSQSLPLRFFGNKGQIGEEYKKMRKKLQPCNDVSHIDSEETQMSLQSAMVDARLFVSEKQASKQKKFNEAVQNLSTIIQISSSVDAASVGARESFITQAKEKIKELTGTDEKQAQAQAQEWLSRAQKQHAKLCDLEEINQIPESSRVLPAS